MCSLQITPACNMPLLSIKNGGKVAIVNLQVHTTKYKHIVVFLLSMDQREALTCMLISVLYAYCTYDIGKKIVTNQSKILMLRLHFFKLGIF